MTIPTRALAASNPVTPAVAPPPIWHRRRAGFAAAVLVGAASALIGAPAAANELPTYRALVDALMAGRSVTTLLDLDLCTKEGSDVGGPKLRGGSRILRFLIPNEQYVAFADTHYTLDAEDRPVVEYIRYRAMPDGSVTVRFATQAGTSGDVKPRGQFRCSFTRGARFMAGEGQGGLPARTRTDASVHTPIRDGRTENVR